MNRHIFRTIRSTELGASVAQHVRTHSVYSFHICLLFSLCLCYVSEVLTSAVSMSADLISLSQNWATFAETIG
jgi:hypothetical protein